MVVQFQQADAAWEVATSILTSSDQFFNFELHFFAAQILKRKIQNEGYNLHLDHRYKISDTVPHLDETTTGASFSSSDHDAPPSHHFCAATNNLSSPLLRGRPLFSTELQPLPPPRLNSFLHWKYFPPNIIHQMGCVGNHSHLNGYVNAAPSTSSSPPS